MESDFNSFFKKNVSKLFYPMDANESNDAF